MTKETDKRQVSIADYAMANGCPAAAEHFDMPVGKVRYLARKIRDRNKRKTKRKVVSSRSAFPTLSLSASLVLRSRWRYRTSGRLSACDRTRRYGVNIPMDWVYRHEEGHQRTCCPCGGCPVPSPYSPWYGTNGP